jgi:hypothetical protein
MNDNSPLTGIICIENWNSNHCQNGSLFAGDEPYVLVVAVFYGSRSTRNCAAYHRAHQCICVIIKRKDKCLTHTFLGPFSSNRLLLLPKGCWRTTLWCKETYSKKGSNLQALQERHPMKPHRLTLTNALVMGYGLDKQIHHIYDPRPATQEELEIYHDRDYIGFLSKFVV